MISVAWYHDLADWLLDVLLFLPRFVFSLFVDFILWAWSLVLSLVGSIAATYQTYVGPVFAGPVGYWADVVAIDVGLGLILGAYVVRFLIRRLPVVG